MVKSENMPWLGEEMRYPRVEDEGFDTFQFSPEQVARIDRTARIESSVNTVADIIRVLANTEIENEIDFINIIHAVSKAGCALGRK